MPPPPFSPFTTRTAQRHSTLPLAAGTSNSSRCCFGIKPITPVRIGCVIFSHRIHTLPGPAVPSAIHFDWEARYGCIRVRRTLFVGGRHISCICAAGSCGVPRTHTHTHTHNPHTQRPSRPHITMAPFPPPAERIDAGPGGHEGGTRRCC